jgi:Uma2 family endonuclease
MPREITLPESKPALEWVNGRVLQKMSPKRRHAIAQGRFYAALDAWAQEGRLGIVGTEWRFRVQPPGEVRRPLVPDVAFLSYARLPYEAQQVTDEPKVGPDAVVEVLSPGDRRADVEEKIRVYLAAGTCVIFIVDPKLRLVRICDARKERTVSEDGVLTHDSLSGFSLEVRRLFSVPIPRSE